MSGSKAVLANVVLTTVWLVAVCVAAHQVINVYMDLLKERETREPDRFLKCHFFNTFFYNKVTLCRHHELSRAEFWMPLWNYWSETLVLLLLLWMYPIIEVATGLRFLLRSACQANEKKRGWLCAEVK